MAKKTAKNIPGSKRPDLSSMPMMDHPQMNPLVMPDMGKGTMPKKTMKKPMKGGKK